MWKDKYYILHISVDYQGTFQECENVNIISYTSSWIIREHFKSVERYIYYILHINETMSQILYQILSKDFMIMNKQGLTFTKYQD